MEAPKGEIENQKFKTNVPTEMEGRIKRFNERLARYIPPREMWTPGEEGLFKPIDLYRVPADEARQM